MMDESWGGVRKRGGSSRLFVVRGENDFTGVQPIFTVGTLKLRAPDDHASAEADERWLVEAHAAVFEREVQATALFQVRFAGGLLLVKQDFRIAVKCLHDVPSLQLVENETDGMKSGELKPAPGAGCADQFMRWVVQHYMVVWA